MQSISDSRRIINLIYRRRGITQNDEFVISLQSCAVHESVQTNVNTLLTLLHCTVYKIAKHLVYLKVCTLPYHDLSILPSTKSEWWLCI